MKKTFFFFIFFSAAIIASAQYKYPPTRTVDSSDTWHGITIRDPYRWLENMKDAEVQKWFKAQADFTNKELAKLPLTETLYREFVALDTIVKDKIFNVRQVGNTLFYYKNKPEENKVKIFRREGEYGKEILVATSDLWGKDYNIMSFQIDPFEKYLLLTAAANGTENIVAKFYDIATGKFLKDTLPGEFASFGQASGEILYEQRPTWDVHTSVSQKDRLFKKHKLGTPVTKDQIYLSYQTNPELYSLDNTTQVWPEYEGRYFDYELLSQGSVSPYFNAYARKAGSNDKWEKLISLEMKVREYYCKGKKIFVVSHVNGPNGSLFEIDLSQKKFDDMFREIVPEQDMPLRVACKTKNYLVIEYVENGVKMTHKVVNLNTGAVTPFPFPENTNLTYIAPWSAESDKIHIQRTGWTTPMTYTYADLSNTAMPEKKLAFREEADFPFLKNLTSEEVLVKGHDGVMIPVSIVHRKDIDLNGQNPVLVYGYGAYGNSSEAFFAPLMLDLVNRGLVLVTAHVRGGGEKGEDWHQAGYKQSKPNTWKDLNSTAEWLIENGYTSPTHLSCMGGSAGGILVGRAVTERPDLWACAVPQVGCLTVVRQEFSPNGPINVPEFGSVKNINEFFALMEMDALLHVQDGVKYPAMLITTGWNDPRVMSWQPAKFAAAVQKSSASGKPALLHVDYSGGHGDSPDKFATLRKMAQQLAFILEYTK